MGLCTTLECTYIYCRQFIIDDNADAETKDVNDDDDGGGVELKTMVLLPQDDVPASENILSLNQHLERLNMREDPSGLWAGI